jgi:hypothetical protein
LKRVTVVTVHYEDASWIDPQRRYLARFMETDYHLHASLEEIPEGEKAKFDGVVDSPTHYHADKLDLLFARAIDDGASDEDILVALDGDAFPIAPLFPRLEQLLRDHPLVAVQRLENNGDRQPHPCFAATTAGFWRQLQGNWQRGYQWRNADGESITDVGGNLLGKLEEKNLNWLPLHRTNTFNLHPVMFGIYGNLVYHHGAGFRNAALLRSDLASLPAGKIPQWMHRWLRQLPQQRGWGRIQRMMDPVARVERRLQSRNRAWSEEVYEQLCADPHFHHRFREPDEAGIPKDRGRCR